MATTSSPDNDEQQQDQQSTSSISSNIMDLTKDKDIVPVSMSRTNTFQNKSITTTLSPIPR